MTRPLGGDPKVGVRTCRVRRTRPFQVGRGACCCAEPSATPDTLPPLAACAAGMQLIKDMGASLSVAHVRVRSLHDRPRSAREKWRRGFGWDAARCAALIALPAYLSRQQQASTSISHKIIHAYVQELILSRAISTLIPPVLTFRASTLWAIVSTPSAKYQSRSRQERERAKASGPHQWKPASRSRPLARWNRNRNRRSRPANRRSRVAAGPRCACNLFDWHLKGSESLLCVLLVDLPRLAEAYIPRVESSSPTLTAYTYSGGL